jgi:hypothetical protein
MGDVTAWLEWFVTVFSESCQASAALIEDLLKKGLIAQGDAAAAPLSYNLAIPGWAWSRN